MRMTVDGRDVEITECVLNPGADVPLYSTTMANPLEVTVTTDPGTWDDFARYLYEQWRLTAFEDGAGI